MSGCVQNASIAIQQIDEQDLIRLISHSTHQTSSTPHTNFPIETARPCPCLHSSPSSCSYPQHPSSSTSQVATHPLFQPRACCSIEDNNNTLEAAARIDQHTPVLSSSRQQDQRLHVVDEMKPTTLWGSITWSGFV